MTKKLSDVSNRRMFNTGTKYYPGIPGEQKFYDAHRSSLFKNIYADKKYDSTFKATLTKTADREKDHHGYSQGKDAEAYAKTDSVREEVELQEEFKKGQVFRHSRHGILVFSHHNSDGHPVFEKPARRGGKQSWPIAVKDKKELKPVNEENILDEDDHKEGDLVLHKGKPKRIMKIIPKGSKMMNHKGEHFTTAHTTLRLDQGKRSWPADVKPHEVKKYNMNKEDFELSESCQKLNAHTFIHNDGHAQSEAFAKDYHKGHKIDHTALSLADEKAWKRHSKNAENFHKKYHEKWLDSSYAGTGVKEYTNTKTGHKFQVHVVSNGRGFHGKDHIIHYLGKDGDDE